MNVLDEVVVLPKPVGPGVLRHTLDDLYTHRVATVCGFSKGGDGMQLVRIKFHDGQFPRDAVWMPRYRVRPYEPPLGVRLNRLARELGRRWRAKLPG